MYIYNGITQTKIPQIVNCKFLDIYITICIYNMIPFQRSYLDKNMQYIYKGFIFILKNNNDILNIFIKKLLKSIYIFKKKSNTGQ